MSDERQQLGQEGERLAEVYLRSRGLKTLDRRYSTPVGELDLVMRDGRTIVFVEVKTLSSRRWADPEGTVGLPKQKKIARCAQWYLRHKRYEDRPCRFDVVGVILPEDGEPEVDHMPDAFLPP